MVKNEFEGARHDIVRHALASIVHRNPQVIPWTEILIRAGRHNVQGIGLDGERPAIGHGMSSIDRQVEDHPLERLAIKVAYRTRRLKLVLHMDQGTSHAADKIAAHA